MQGNNRELRFRAWDTGKGMKGFVPKMFDWDYLTSEETGLFWWFMSHQDGVCVLMQYTGLKDKNGTEVYEGDIVKQSGNSWGEVFKVPEFDFLHGWTKLALSEPFEVIGNIYESPELLKV